MASIGEMIDEDIPDNPVKQAEKMQEQQQEKRPQQPSKSAFDVLKAKSPDKPVSEYMDSSLNIFGAEWFARILRGCEGLLGEQFSDFAVFDILRGSYEGFFKRKNRENKEQGKQKGGLDESEN